jgi:hypothetical protein
LPSGEVLVAGGAASAADGGNMGSLSEAEVFDPAKGTWRAVGSLSSARAMAQATVVGGKVLVVGGFDSGSNMPRAAELYDPATSTFGDGGSLVGAGRIFLALTTLANGDVLTAGGMSYDPKKNTSEFLDENERFTGGAWKQNGALATPRNAVSLLALSDGRALALGGYDYNPAYNGPLSGVEIFEPTQNAWFQMPTLKNARMAASSTLLQDGRVLVCGGTGPLDTLGTCELGKAP